jgi:hypothetical protein
MTRWRHPHTLAAGLIAGIWWSHDPRFMLGFVVAAFLIGVGLGRFWHTVKRASRIVAETAWLKAESNRQALAIKRAHVRTARATARLAEAKARDGKAVAVEARRRADRARGVTNSEIAQLQMGKP